jgi:hypothetical protein
MITWSEIKHFEQREFDDALHPGSGERINMILVLNLDYLWERVYTISGAKPAIIITQAVDLHGEHGHAPQSYHLAAQGCKAADFIIITMLDPRIQYQLVERQGFGGIGIYYDWRYKGKAVPIGFHADLRPTELIQRWRRINGEYFYLLGRR